MPDYKEMYLKMFRATEAAVNILIAAQRDREEMYIREQEPVVHIVPSVKSAEDQHK